MRFEIVDVFAEEPLAGNPLAVVRDCGELTTARMQAMAFEMNFSETTFVVDEGPSRARVRIFTPTQELPFAGHPTLGTAAVLRGSQDRYTLELDAGDVPVEFRDGIAWMEPPPVELLETYSANRIGEWLDLPSASFDPDYETQRARVGIEFLFTGLDSRERLRQLRPDLATLQRLPAFSLFAFTAEGCPEGIDYAARMFFDANGLREDPATGSANSAFAAYLRQARGDDFDVTVLQGVEMGRPSRIELQVRAGRIRVGGRVQSVARGEWTLRPVAD